jgi:hypothetical protein
MKAVRSIREYPLGIISFWAEKRNKKVMSEASTIPALVM